jgi:membrane protease subunit HflK
MVRYVLGMLGLAILVYGLTSVTQVRPGERAIVRRFGRVVDRPGPGLWIGLPYGMDRVDHVPVDLVRGLRIGYMPDADEDDQATPLGQLLTGDHNLVNVQLVIDYAVGASDEEIENYVVQGERAEGIVSRAAEAVLAEWVGGRTVDEVLLRGKTELPILVVERTQARIDPYHLGIQIQAASVSHLLPPYEVKQSFDDVTSEQTRIRTREYAAREAAARKLRSAQADRDRIEKLTAAYVKEQRLLALADAETFEQRLRQYQELRRDNPHILAGIWWDEIGKLFTRMKENGRIDLLDNRLGSEGLDITVAPPLPRKK